MPALPSQGDRGPQESVTSPRPLPLRSGEPFGPQLTPYSLPVPRLQASPHLPGPRTLAQVLPEEGPEDRAVKNI